MSLVLAEAILVDRFLAPQRMDKISSNLSAPCACETESRHWVPPERTEFDSKCLFIDLGAANGNTFEDFLNNRYVETAYCPLGHWEAVLVEANPRFDTALRSIAAKYQESSARVQVMPSTAAFMCEAEASFFLDTVNQNHSYWGSSLSSRHPDVQKSGLKKVRVPTLNLNQLIVERAIPADYVILKLDVEGAEYDILPCLAKSSAASLVDVVYVEVHQPSLSLTGTTPAAFEASLVALKAKGVDIPDYSSPTF